MMDLKRRSFIKLVGLAGVAFATPGLTIADIIPKTGQKNAAQTKECKDFGEFLVSVADSEGAAVTMPNRFVGILGRTAKKAGILGRLKRDKLVAIFYTSEVLLEDNAVLGDIAWQQLNEAISYQKPKPFERFSNNARDLSIKVAYNRNDQMFRFIIRAI